MIDAETLARETVDKIYMKLKAGNGVWNSHVPSYVCADILPDIREAIRRSPGESSAEPTRLELIAALTCAESILWMAESHAEYMGQDHVREFNEASATIRAVLARCTEGKKK